MATKKTSNKRSLAKIYGTNRYSLLIFIVIFAALGTYLILRSFAASTVGVLEAELLTGSGNVVSDNSAQQGKALSLTNTTAATGTLTTTAMGDTLTLRAKGVQCHGAPQVAITVDGQQKLLTSVSSTSYTGYSVATSISQASHSVTAKLTNPYAKHSCARSVSLDYISVTSNSSPVTTAPLTVTLTVPTNGSTVSGGVPVQATASGSAGVTKVEFYFDNTLKATDSVAPYCMAQDVGAGASSCYNWDSTTVANGSHTITAYAYDSVGTKSAASTVTFTVNNPVATPVPSGKSTWRPVNSPILSDAEAASHVIRSSFEPRPGNFTPNHTVPTQAERDYYNAQSQNYETRGLFTGNFTGTTDETIQWVSWKWGLDEDVVRAVAAVESWWNQNAYGCTSQGGGLTSPTWSQNPGSCPMAMNSTAANLEIFAGYMRQYYDNYQGKSSWLNDVDHGQTYAAGDEWGSIGAWYAGRWHTAAAESYITKVKDYETKQVWAQPGF